MLKIFLGILTTLSLQIAWAQVTPEQSFQAGVEQFQKSQFDEARKSFSDCLGSSQYRLSCLYNLGNTAYKQQRFGEALAYYRLMLNEDPGNRDAKANAQLAFSALKVKSLPGPVNSYEIYRSTVLNVASIDAFLAATFISLLILGLSAVRFSKKVAESRASEEERPKPSAFNWVSLGIFIICLFTTATKLYDLTIDRGTIVSSKTEVKSGPGESNATIFEISEGLEVLILTAHNDWFQVNYPGGLTGWIPKKDLVITNGTTRW